MNNIQKISLIVGVACIMATLLLASSNNGKWFIYEAKYTYDMEKWYSRTEYHWMTIIPTCLSFLCGLTFYLYKDD